MLSLPLPFGSLAPSFSHLFDGQRILRLFMSISHCLHTILTTTCECVPPLFSLPCPPPNKWNMRVDHIQLHHKSWTAIVKSWQKKQNRKKRRKKKHSENWFLSFFVRFADSNHKRHLSQWRRSEQRRSNCFSFLFRSLLCVVAVAVVAVVVFGRNNGKTVTATVAWKTVIFIYFLIYVFLSSDRASPLVRSIFTVRSCISFNMCVCVSCGHLACRCQG